MGRALNLCFIGKYPPIEGGVSSSNYWLARGLAERGHHVNVVTNADEVEATYRMHLEPGDWDMYQPRFSESGGWTRVFNTEAFAYRTMDHVPHTNPTVAKLAGVATGVVRSQDCEAIFAYYYEPYAVAASLVAHWTGRPLIIKHAGSDLDRLFRVPDLATTYKEVLRGADAVVTRQPLRDRFLGIGVPEDVLRTDVGYAVPQGFFKRDGLTLDVEHLKVQDFPGVADRSSAEQAPTFDPALFTFGIYGKIGATKGTFDLIKALTDLADAGLQFNLLAMIGAPQVAYLMPALVDGGLLRHTYILPFLPNWRVPEFIRTCDAVCFLERGFPVAIHGPVVPREVLACGTCLVLSGEIADKQMNSQDFVRGMNFIRVDDPQDREELREALRRLILDPSSARKIGAEGQRIPQSSNGYGEYIASWEQIFEDVSREGKNTVDRRTAGRAGDVAPVDPLTAFAPHFRTALADCAHSAIEDFASTNSISDPAQAGLALCSALFRLFSEGADLPNAAKLRDALEYQRARLESAFDSDDNTPPFVVVDQLRDNPFEAPAIGRLRPVRGNFVQVLELTYDVTPLFADLDSGPAIFLGDLEETQMQVLFQRTANGQLKEMKINDATRQLVARCDGKATTEELVLEMSAQLGSNPSDIAAAIYGALATLYREGVIVFGERNSGWGWTGGSRWTPEVAP
jgi:glycosyltransferase involved in cell wall biosynthesis